MHFRYLRSQKSQKRPVRVTMRVEDATLFKLFSSFGLITKTTMKPDTRTQLMNDLVVWNKGS